MNILTPDTETTRSWHETFARQTNHLVWDILSKPERTQAEDEGMVHAAHASRYHWEEVGTSIHLTRGDWLLSHVYAVLNQPQAALAYATSCLRICQQEHIGDFDLAYAYEAMARAYAALGQKSQCDHYYQLAQEAGDNIQNIEPEDKDIFFDDFRNGPWFGLK